MMEEVVLSIGAATFPEVLFRCIRDSAPVQQLSIFRYSSNGQFESLAAEAVGNPAAMRKEVQNYVERYHALDPGNCGHRPAAKRRVSIDFIDSWAIEDDEFRTWMRVRQKISGKATIIVRRPEDTFVIDLLRCPAVNEFSFEAKQYLTGSSGIIASAVERHFELVRPSARSSISTWSRYMQRLPGLPPLSMQEAVVCAHILEGHSNKAIALDVGISIHSVVTYRRRAYSKLNIASQNELFSLLLRSRGSDADGRIHTESQPRASVAESLAP